MCHWDFSTIMKLICNWNILCCHKREQKHPRLVDWRCYLIVSVIYRQMLVVIACLAKFAYRNDIMFQWYYGLVLTFRRVDWDSFHYVWKWLSSNPMLTILFYFIIHHSAFGLGFGGNQSSNTTVFKLSGHCLITHNLLQFHFSQLTHSLMLMLPTATAPLISWLRQPKTVTL